MTFVEESKLVLDEILDLLGVNLEVKFKIVYLFDLLNLNYEEMCRFESLGKLD